LVLGVGGVPASELGIILARAKVVVEQSGFSQFFFALKLVAVVGSAECLYAYKVESEGAVVVFLLNQIAYVAHLHIIKPHRLVTLIGGIYLDIAVLEGIKLQSQ
jgi:hypothetical protein